MKKAAIVALIVVAIGGAALLLISRRHESPREAFAHKVVRTLAANNWGHSVIGTFLCDNKVIREMYDREKNPVSFGPYREYGGIKAIGRIKLTDPASFPQIAMDTFVPVLFNERFAPYPTMPDHIFYHAAYIQLATQESSDGKLCLVGWGHNDFPVDPNQTDDFLKYQGIFVDN